MNAPPEARRGAARPAVDWRRLVEAQPVSVSAPCRVDMGGTLDIRTFSYPLQAVGPLTLNVALDLRTTTTIRPHARGRIRVDSRGFRPADFPADAAPFRHPLGLIFAVAAFFQAEGLAIAIRSDSPPRSALGGSSTAAAALTAAFFELARRAGIGPPPPRATIALTAHGIEESVAGVPCGYQDQLAAVFGGVHAWHWLAPPKVFRREVVWPPGRAGELDPHMLVAYAGVPHASSEINWRWIRQFVAGRNRGVWAEIARLTHAFADALRRRDFAAAAAAMNRETALRRRLTPEVLDPLGVRLVAAARRAGCGARFTGAGGGGCLWAIGSAEAIARLAPRWREILAGRRGARLLAAPVAPAGLRLEPSPG